MGPPKKAKAKASGSGSAKKEAKKTTSKETQPMALDGEQAGPSTPAVWRPGLDEVGEDEELQYDPSTYDCMHHMSLDWPCLSFDILQDGLGGPRSTFPHTITMVAGTQAANPRQNSLALMKLSNLGQGKHGDKAAKEDDSDDDMSDSNDDEEGNPVMHLRQVALSCGVNRVRAMPQQPGVIAAWGDNGQVSIWDMGMQVNEVTLAEDERAQRGRPQRQEPRHVHRHSTEGFALDWSRAAAGRLASGDCRRGIHVWDANEKGNWSVSGRYQGHEDSVEDIQWSPVEGTVFASCSVDKTIRIWDTRGKAVPQLSVTAHATDVNVISWSAQSTFMLASGGDDGALRVWDLRMFGRDAAANEASYVANFTYHRGPVTSVEWCPAEPTMLATSSADGQLAVWDLAVERDPEEEAALAASMNAASPEDLPAQLLFVHLSQGEVKEAHWHPQIPGLLVSTAAEGFTIFKPSNVP
ncbi:g10729 [Coccomyxa elongata]